MELIEVHPLVKQIQEFCSSRLHSMNDPTAPYSRWEKIYYSEGTQAAFILRVMECDTTAQLIVCSYERQYGFCEESSGKASMGYIQSIDELEAIYNWYEKKYSAPTIQ